MEKTAASAPCSPLLSCSPRHPLLQVSCNVTTGPRPAMTTFANQNQTKKSSVSVDLRDEGSCAWFLLRAHPCCLTHLLHLVASGWQHARGPLKGTPPMALDTRSGSKASYLVLSDVTSAGRVQAMGPATHPIILQPPPPTSHRPYHTTAPPHTHTPATADPLPYYSPPTLTRPPATHPTLLLPPTPHTHARPPAKGLFTSTDPETRRVAPTDVKNRVRVKVVYVVLEAQYQSAISQAVKNINAKNSSVCFEVVGYLLEELRDNANFEAFKVDVADANVFIGSLIFIEELAEKVSMAQNPSTIPVDP